MALQETAIGSLNALLGELSVSFDTRNVAFGILECSQFSLTEADLDITREVNQNLFDFTVGVATTCNSVETNTISLSEVLTFSLPLVVTSDNELSGELPTVTLSEDFDCINDVGGPLALVSVICDEEVVDINELVNTVFNEQAKRIAGDIFIPIRLIDRVAEDERNYDDDDFEFPQEDDIEDIFENVLEQLEDIDFLEDLFDAFNDLDLSDDSDAEDGSIDIFLEQKDDIFDLIESILDLLDEFGIDTTELRAAVEEFEQGIDDFLELLENGGLGGPLPPRSLQGFDIPGLDLGFLNERIVDLIDDLIGVNEVTLFVNLIFGNATLTDLVENDFQFDIEDIAQNLDIEGFLTLLDPRAPEILDLIFESNDTPNEILEFLQKTSDFVRANLNNVLLDFDEVFPQEAINLLTVISLFDPLVEENLEAISSGQVTVGEFFGQAGLDKFDFDIADIGRVSAQFNEVSFRVNDLEVVDPTLNVDVFSIILPSIDVQALQISLNVDLLVFDNNDVQIGDVERVTVDINLDALLEAAVSPVIDVDGLLDIGFFDIDDVEDIAQVSGNIGACGGSRVGIAITTLAPDFELTFDVTFQNIDDEGLGRVLAGLLELYQVIPNTLINNAIAAGSSSTINFVDDAEEACAAVSIRANSVGGDDPGANVGLIVGGIIGALVFIAVIAYVVVSNNSKKQAAANVLEADEVKYKEDI